MAHTFPAATGFLVSVQQGGDRAPGPVFATRGAHATVAEPLRTQTLNAVLVHSGSAGDAVARSGDTALVVAGELYNREELLSLLPAGTDARTDARLLLALLGVYDLHAFRLLNGRFAAAVALGDRVLLATDHAGSVPLYTLQAPGRVLAATEIKTLVPATAQAPPSGRPVAEARRVRRVPGVHQVPAGTVLDIGVRTGTAVPSRTWTPPVSRRVLPEADATAAVREALERAVRERTGGTTPLVVLSGGIDSSGVAALAAAHTDGPLDTLSMGTDTSDEFAEARVVATHLGSAHREITVPTADLLAQLPYAVWASESIDPDIIEYLLPLTALYRALDGPARRILTGYGADIPLAGMHREDRLPQLDTAVASDMATFDGLNEMTPVLSGIQGHWSTHPYWDRDVLDLLVSLEAGLKRRHGRDKWVLREAMSDLLPQETVTRPKLGVHEGSGTTSSFSLLLMDAGVPDAEIHQAKSLVVREVFDRVVVEGLPPAEVSTADAVEHVAARLKETE
ncbi:asparagine synthetase B family protein [Streptomyces sp. NBC_01754]|nr:asparagine synthase-related protein [Streptomyces sp. NBC_01754]WSC91412.1 asparagine synthetase B family protein [Streptomyces sp. NBC_01754]